MPEALARLKERMATVAGLRHASDVLSWDQETMMPPGGIASRAGALAALERVAHDLGASSEYGRLLEAAEAEAANRGLEAGSDDARLLWRARKDFEQERKLPTAFVGELRETEARGNQVWQEARRANDFAMFAPVLERLVSLQRQKADYFGYDDHPYDALLDLFEPGSKTADIRRVFDDVREQTVPLVHAIAARAGTVDDACVRQHFPTEAQWDLARDISRQFGYDFNHGRIDPSAHPFTTDFGADDVRFTIRDEEGFFNPAFFAAAHECGHALHALGVPARYYGTSLWGHTSSGIAESQSRLWENLVARSRPFWRYYLPRARESFPAQFAAVDAEQIYRAVNKSTPSLIRVEADEVTYNLHIMLRFDLEIGLVAGEVQVRDLPRLWRDKMEEYLGIVPPTDAEGVLQDIHWSLGAFGYFPTYALGNLMSVQLYDAANRALGDVAGQVERGEFAPLLGWMRDNVHAVGNRLLPGEALERATGQRLNAAPYVAYLRRKYGELYGLSAG